MVDVEPTVADAIRARNADQDREAARLVTRALAETDLFFNYARTHDGNYIWMLVFDGGAINIRLTVQHGFLLGAAPVGPLPGDAELGALLKSMPLVTQVRFMVADAEGESGEALEPQLCIAGDLPVIPGIVPNRSPEEPRLAAGDVLRFVGNLIRGVQEYRKLTAVDDPTSTPPTV